MKRLINKDFVGFLAATRIPNLLVIGSTQYLTAFFLISDYPGKMSDIGSWSFFLLVVSTVMISAGGYVINDYYDAKVDMINRPEKVVVGTLLRRRLAMVAHLILTLGAITIGFYLDVKVGVVHIFSSFFLWYYSNFLRRLPLIGNVIIAFLTGLTLLIVAVYLEKNALLVYIYSLFAMAVILIREILKDIEDLKGDAAFGIQSLPNIFGVRGAKIVIYLICIGSSGLLGTYLIATDNWIVRYYFLGLLPVFLWFVYKLIVADRQSQFHTLINFTNLIILSGIISMLTIRPWG